MQHSPDRGRLAENLVFTELIKRGLKNNRDIFYYKTRNGREVDFAIKEGHRIGRLIQASYRADNPETERREVGALFEAAEELGAGELVILTWDEERQAEKDGKTVSFVPLWKWLTGKR